jgi:hypothetical protein
LSKGPKTLTNTSTSATTIDPALKARQDALWQQAGGIANQPYQPYTGERVAGLTPDQLASFEAARGAAGAGIGELDAASGGAGLLGMTSRSDLYSKADEAVGAGVSARSGAAGYKQYMDPYTGEVIDAAMSDLEQNRGDVQNQIRLRQAAEGAFGGSRSGVEASLTNRDFARQAAATAAGLRSQGFDRALGYNAADQNRELQAGTASAANATAASLANAGNKLQAGLGAGNLRLNALNLLGNFGAQRQRMGAYGADLLSRSGGQQQAQDQMQKDVDYQAWQEAQNDPYKKTDLLSRILQSGQYGTSTSTTSTVPNPNRGSFLGTLGGIAGIAGGLIPGLGLAKGLLGVGAPKYDPNFTGQ